MVFHWSLSDNNSSRVSRTLLSILAVLNNAVVWMVSTRLPTSKSSNPFSNPLVTVPNAPITIGIIVTCMLHSYYYYYYYYPLKLFTSALAHGFSLEFECQQSPQVFRTLLSILAVLNNSVVWTVSTQPPTSKSSRPFNNPLVTVPKAPITIGIWPGLGDPFVC